MTANTLAEVYELLSPKDKRILCFAINKHGHHMDVDAATVAFVHMETALSCVSAALLATTADSAIGKRTYTELQFRLKSYLGQPKAGTTRVTRRLNDAKVAKFFGDHPERGIAIQARKVKVTAGLKWSLPKREYVPNTDVMVSPMVSLKCLAKGTWQVFCDAKYLSQVDRFLVDNCM